ncbi:phosphopentomutase [Clostridium celatum]|uniref:Phosphopentomutase n=1 Tax=Clostridium celatum DSM 1785 TaxID=545697 RepID=L1QGG0_9CLOT|nr:phosphopentomutase [Clostridium celatum]EKY27026.1 phosphopentomutase [Clostridium celatum DSM 1785]MCE9654715.1 phosphopentomutase [Clostridium celatum]MDU3723743.1 phosphopentomutase [Clostridium celatum]MDU6295834.1 phosphopentomutase [Clostridium celatum]MDY3362098.1 phosphopentomutase [Clostridium celatum]
MKRAILIVLDSLGVGELPDAKNYGDEGSHTLDNICKACGKLNIDELEKLGIGNIEGVTMPKACDSAIGAYGRSSEKSMGKDTVTGHWEIGGVILEKPLNTYPDGFSKEIIDEFLKRTNKENILGNTVASGTAIIEELGEEHVKTGYPIIYTSADSVFQIAAHEDVIPVEELYKMCEIAREMLVDKWAVGRVIARPFTGEVGSFKRTSNRRDYALDPFNKTMLEYLKESGKEVAAVGKIEDIYNKKGVTLAVHTKNNMDGVDKTLEYMDTVKEGLIFTNLVDFDMLYGHRNDAKGYGKAIEEFNDRLQEIYAKMTDEDMLILTADHGCDPTTASTDHSREYIPILVYGKNLKGNVNLGTRETFADIGKTILDFFNVENELVGKSFLNDIRK